MDVAALVAQMNEALASIHTTIEDLSISAAESDTKLDELEQKRDMTIAELKAAYEKEQEELTAARQKELEEIAEQRRREDEEREARRRKEDEELAARKAKEDEEKRGTFDTTARNVEDEMDDLMDNIEEETAKKIAEGEAKLAELEEKRKELNRLIEEQMKAAVPPIPTRKRARTVRKSGAVRSIEPSPLPPAETSAEPAIEDKRVEEKKSKPAEEPLAEEKQAEESAAERPAQDKAPEGAAPAPAENGTVPEETAEEGKTSEDEVPQPSEEAPAATPAEEEKIPEGDDSTPQLEEPVAERSVEGGTSTEEAQSSEDTPQTETANPEIEQVGKEEAGSDSHSDGVTAPADVPEPEPEPAPAEDVKEEATPEEPVNGTAAAEDSRQSAPAESDETLAEAQDAALLEEKDDIVDPKETTEEAPESAPVEEPAVGEPSTEEPADEELAAPEEAPIYEPASEETLAPEETPVVEEAPTAKEAPTAEEPADDGSPAVEASAEKASETVDAAAEVTPVAEAEASVTPKEDAAADEAHAETASQTEETKASEEDVSVDATEVNAPTLEDTTAPGPAENAEEEHDKPAEEVTLDKLPAGEQTTDQCDDAVPEHSLVNEDDTQKTDNEEVAVEAVNDTSVERSTPEISIEAVVDEPGADETPAADSTEQAEEEVQTETEQAAAHPEMESFKGQDASDVSSKAVEQEPSQGEATPLEDTQPQEETIASEEALAENETPAEDASLDETKKCEDDTSAPEEAPVESGRLIDEAPDTQEDSPQQEDKTRTESAKEPESPTEVAEPAQEHHSHDTEAAVDSQAAEDVLVQDKTPSPEETSKEEVASEQEEVPVTDEAPTRDEAPSPEEDKPEDILPARDVPVEEDVSAENEPEADDEVSTQDESSVEDKAEAVAAEPSSKEQTTPEDTTEAAVPEVSEHTTKIELTAAENTPEKPDQDGTEMPLVDNQPAAKSDDVTQESTVGSGEVPPEQDSGEGAAHVAAEGEGSNEAEFEVTPSDVQPTEERISEVSPTEDAEPDVQTQSNQDAEPTEIKKVAEQGTRPTDDEVQAQPDPQEAQVEVSEPSPTTQEKEEHLPTTTQEDLEDDDSEHRGASHPPEEQPAGSVPDIAADDSAARPYDAATDAPADPGMMEDIEADEEAQPVESEGHLEDDDVEGASTSAEYDEETPAAFAEEGQADKADGSADSDSQTEAVKAQTPDSDDREEAHDYRNMPLSAEPTEHKTFASQEAGQDAPSVVALEQADKEEVNETSAEDRGHDELERSHTREISAEGLEEIDDDQVEVALPAGAHEEAEKAVIHGDDVQEQESEMSADEEDTLDISHTDNHHEHDGEDAAVKDSPSRDVVIGSEPSQHDSYHAEVEIVDPSHDDVSFEYADRSRHEPDLSVITEHTEPATSSVGDTSGVVAKNDEFFRPDSMSRNVSEVPDVELNSSYMTEPPSMAADQSYGQDQKHDSFLPSSSASVHDDEDHVATSQVHFDEQDDNHSSSVQSVRDDNDVEEPPETSYNPFARANAVGYQQPAYQSQDIPYNPFALPTVAEEEAPQETYNPFANRTVDEAAEAPYNPFARNTTDAADNFLRSASALGHSQPSSPEQTFARSASAQGHRDSVSSNNPFARSMTPADQSFLPTASTLGEKGVAPGSFSNNPFARSTSAHGNYEPTDSESDDDEAFAAAESTYKNLFPVGHGSPIANHGSTSAVQSIEHRQPTPQVPESMYNNPFAARGSAVGGDVDESRFHQSFSSAAGGFEYPDEDSDESLNPAAHRFAQDNSPLSARHLAPTTLDSIQERYNSELEDMDSDSEEPESLTTSQQLPASQQRAIPPMPSIAERSRQGFDDSDNEEDWNSGVPQTGHINALLTSSEHRSSPPPPPPLRAPSSQGLYPQEVEESSEDDGDIFQANHAQPALPSTLSSSQYSATPPPPPPPPLRVLSSQGHYDQQLEDSSEEEQNEWDGAFTPAQSSTLPTTLVEAVPPRASPLRAQSSLSQSRLEIEDSDEEDQGTLASGIVQPNIPSLLSTSGHRAVPPPPPPPRASSSQGLHHEEQPDSSEDEAPYSQKVARPGQFPISSSSQLRVTPPSPPPPRAPSSQGQYGQGIEDSVGEEHAWDSNATAPDQIPTLSTSRHRAAPPPPPRAPKAEDRNTQELGDSDSEEDEEAWEANGYGQTTNVMGASNLMGNNQMGVDPMGSASPPRTNPMRASSPLASTSAMVQSNPMESAFRESAPAASIQDLQSHQREGDGEESDDSWENIGQRDEAHVVKPADPTSTAPAPTPQLRVDNYEQHWPNASNDQISTASTYLQPAGPGDFTDTESQEYATPLPSAGFSASSQYTQGAMESPRHPESVGMKDVYDQSYNRGAASSPHDREASYAHETSLAEELARGDDSDDDSEYDHTQAPAFLTQIGTAQRQQQQDEFNKPIQEQVIDSFHSDEDDGPKTAVLSSDEYPTQYSSSRFGATSWRDELRSPTLFGATRHSRSGSLREQLQKSLHQDVEPSHTSPLQAAHQPEAHAQEPYEQQQSLKHDQEASVQQTAQIHGQEVYSQQPVETNSHLTYVQQPTEAYARDLDAAQQDQMYGQDASAQQQFNQSQYGQQQPATWQPEVKVSEVHAEEEHEQTTPQLTPQQSEQAPDISPLALRQESPATPSSRGTPSRGLTFSRHNPDRPQTPPSRPATEEDIDPELMIPRDVTNVPWHARNDSVPYSMRSQSTIDSVASSPVHSALHADKHEPVIRDSWPASVHNLTRPRNDSTLTDRDDYDPFRFEGGTKPMRGPSGSVGSSSDSPPRNTASNSSPGSLISRMRGIFENPQAKQEPVSPVRSRPVSGVFHPVRRTKPGGEDDGPGHERKAGYLNEAEDEVDEQSALLRSSAGGLEAN